MPRARPARSRSAAFGVWLAVALIGNLSGCASWKHGSVWVEGGLAPKLGAAAPRVALAGVIDASDSLAEAQRHYQQAESEAAAGSARCVDEFYLATVASWQAKQFANSESDAESAWRLYHESLGRLIREAREHDRLSPTGGLVVECAGVRRNVPVEFHGFPWKPTDFHEWHVVGGYWHRLIPEPKVCDGLGVPLVIVRHEQTNRTPQRDFLPPVTAFAATAVLKPDGSSLVICNPLQVACVEIGGARIALARDLTSSIVYGLHFYEQSWLEGFIRPNRADDAAELRFVEPFQPDKVPLILVHGLLSSPDAWGAIENELRAAPDLVDGYQIWTFRYSTGAPFVRSAAELRAQLDEVQMRFDPEDTNPALRRVVLVGHSMGGLISRLMIAHSGETVWNAVANLPLEQVATDEATRGKLAERMYFDPHPLVNRVVFLATPHQGSATAGRAVGKLAGTLVSQVEPQYEQLMRDNVGGFKTEVSRRLPTSIDMLDPRQPFLETLSRLPLNRCVTVHSIIGTGRGPLQLRNSDGIVPVDSAHFAGAASEVFVPASHSGILRHRDTFAELERILRLHLAETSAAATSALVIE